MCFVFVKRKLVDSIPGQVINASKIIIRINPNIYNAYLRTNKGTTFATQSRFSRYYAYLLLLFAADSRIRSSDKKRKEENRGKPKLEDEMRK